MGRPKSKLSKRDRLASHVRSVIKRMVQRPIATCLGAIGLAGLPDDLDTWSKWIDKVTRDETVLALAKEAVAFAEFVNQPYIRLLLVMVGLLVLAWKVPAFWRLRNRIAFAWSAKVSEVVWINRDKALSLMRNSRWGSLKKPQGSWADIVGNPMKVGMSDTDKAMERYSSFLELSLDSFEENNPTKSKVQEGVRFYDQAALSVFVGKAMRDEVEQEFGNIPDVRVGDA